MLVVSIDSNHTQINAAFTGTGQLQITAILCLARRENQMVAAFKATNKILQKF
jgi:hypothetical protein